MIAHRFTSARNKNLVKHRKVSIYDETDCVQRFLFLFVFLLKTKFVKNCHFYDSEKIGKAVTQ